MLNNVEKFEKSENLTRERESVCVGGFAAVGDSPKLEKAATPQRVTLFK